MSKTKEEVISVEAEDPLALRAEVGRMLESSQADDRKMIRLVRERPLLYARNNMPVASYYTQVKQLWQEVAHTMAWSVADVRRKWSHIRNSYSRHLRNEMYGARTGKGRVVSRWYLADELQFLREHMATDTRSSPYSQYLPTMVQTTLSEPQADPNVDMKPFINNPWFTLATTRTKLEPSEHHNDDSSNSQAFDADENSAYFQFFRGIYNDYQELTPKKQRLFRRQCLNFLHDLLDEGEVGRTEIQNDAMNLSNSMHHSDDEKEQKLFVIENIDSVSNN